MNYFPNLYFLICQSVVQTSVIYLFKFSLKFTAVPLNDDNGCKLLSNWRWFNFWKIFLSNLYFWRIKEFFIETKIICPFLSNRTFFVRVHAVTVLERLNLWIQEHNIKTHIMWIFKCNTSSLIFTCVVTNANTTDVHHYPCHVLPTTQQLLLMVMLFLLPRYHHRLLPYYYCFVVHVLCHTTYSIRVDSTQLNSLPCIRTYVWYLVCLYLQLSSWVGWAAQINSTASNQFLGGK